MNHFEHSRLVFARARVMEQTFQSSALLFRSAFQGRKVTTTLVITTSIVLKLILSSNDRLIIGSDGDHSDSPSIESRHNSRDIESYVPSVQDQQLVNEMWPRYQWLVAVLAKEMWPRNHLVTIDMWPQTWPAQVIKDQAQKDKERWTIQSSLHLWKHLKICTQIFENIREYSMRNLT